MITQQQRANSGQSFGYMTAKAVVFCFGLLGIGTTTLILITFHDAIVKYGDSLKWLMFISFAILVVLVLVFIAVNLFLIVERRAIETEIIKQNNFLPRTINAMNARKANYLATDEKEEEAEFVTFTDEKTYEIYSEMIASDSFSLNQLATEIYGNKGGEYNKKLRKSLAKFGVNI